MTTATRANIGGTAEYIAAWLKKIGHEPYFYWYVTVCIAISLCVCAAMRDTRHPSRIDRDHEPAGA